MVPRGQLWALPRTAMPPHSPGLTPWLDAGDPQRWSGRWNAVPRGPWTRWHPSPPRCSLQGMGAHVTDPTTGSRGC